MYHRGLGRFELRGEGAYLAGEPGDCKLARRMWAGRRAFAFLDRIVTTYYWVPARRAGPCVARVGSGRAGGLEEQGLDEARGLQRHVVVRVALQHRG